MTTPTKTDLTAVRAHASGPAADAVATLTDALRAGLAGRQARAVLYFASAAYDPRDLAGPLASRFPEAAVMGCSTAGEFTDAVSGTGAISAVAVPEGLLTQVSAVLGNLDGDVAKNTDLAVLHAEAQLGRPLRDLDPARHFGLVLIDGMHGDEESVNERLGNAAPLLDIVGGSAGDDLAFDHTWVAVGSQVSERGFALMICATAAPFQVVKTCSFTPAPGRPLRITKADVPNRTVLEFDHRPAAAAYAEAIGVPVDELDTSVWMQHPVGLMIDGQPWIRSPRTVTPDGGLAFYAQILPDMDVHVMNAGDLVGETAAAVAAARTQLGGHPHGAIWFNCILRRLELDAEGQMEPFLAALGDIPAAGFHTYGETWLGHVNQTLTGIVFG
ncbi:MAG TPA: FIST N-terminal domain-containing protein [Kineosporiaceae bacterium]|nr:FIST N-terminal domain-containing protein [Kineosporiaceae bacterium]